MYVTLTFKLCNFFLMLTPYLTLMYCPPSLFLYSFSVMCPSEATDPALSDPSLQRRLRSNREVALSRLEEVITKYAVKQEDTEEQERNKRLKKDSKEKEVREHLSCLSFVIHKQNVSSGSNLNL